jgi:hypothetical protein
MSHKQFLVKKINGGLANVKWVNLEDQNKAIVKLNELKSSN